MMLIMYHSDIKGLPLDVCRKARLLLFVTFVWCSCSKESLGHRVAVPVLTKFIEMS